MTNQNDTQDEAEKLAEEAYPDTRIMGEMVDRSHERMVYVDGYRAGVATVADKHLELAVKYSDLAGKYCASFAEVERLVKAADKFRVATCKYADGKMRRVVFTMHLDQISEALANYSTDSGDGEKG